MNKKVQTWLPLLFSIFLVLGMLLGYKLRDNMGTYAPSFWNAGKQNTLQEAASIIHDKYVDALPVDRINTEVLEAVLQQLDPYSVYIPANAVQQMNDALKDQFEGIGVQYQILNDTPTVLRTIPGGPAAKAGMEPGDQLIAADTSSIVGKKINAELIQLKFRGKRQSKVEITLLRAGKPMKLSLTRDVIDAPPIAAAYMISAETGFIKLDRFSEQSYEAFMVQLEKLQKQGMKKLILDLRGNGGGLLEEAVQIADEFIGNNKLILYTQGKASPRKDYLAKRPGLFEEGKLAILIDEESASASEVLAGAVQDWDRGVIVGSKSFGKGLVQEQFSLRDGSMLRLSVSRYYTPLGRNLQKPMEEKTERNPQACNKKIYRTNQGKKLYAADGITPDVEVGVDTLAAVWNDTLPGPETLVLQTALRYYQENKKTLLAFNTALSTCEALGSETAIPAMLISMMKENYLRQKAFSNADINTLRLQCIATIVAMRWGTEGATQCNNANDPVVQKAVSLLAQSPTR